MTEPKVSIIIPVYNAEKSLRKCLEKLLQQTYKCFEVICVDDGSSDSSFTIMQEFNSKDNRIKIFRNENNGPAYTRHFAITQASGEYLMFCDADDWYESTMVEKMVNAIEKQNVDLVMCDCNIVDIADGKLQREEQKKYNNIQLLGKVNLTTGKLKKINAILWNKLFKKDLIDKYNIEYPKKYEHDDSVFLLKYLAYAKTYYGLNEKLYNYVVGNANSIMGQLFTSTNKGKEFDFIYAYEDLFDYLKDFKNLDYIMYVKKIYIEVFVSLVEYLPDDMKNLAFSKLIDVINTNKFFNYDNPKCIKLLKLSKNYNDFTNYLNKYCSNITFIKQIFSIINEGKYKVIRLFGFKIKLKRKHYILQARYNRNTIIKILIAYHKKMPLLVNDICIPIHLGRALGNQISKDGTMSENDYQWMLDNMIGDNTGDNISCLNRKFNELTAMYWAWKNYDKLGNPDYIGFMHYRTIFSIDSYPSYDTNYMDSNGYTEKILSGFLNEYSFLCAHFINYEKNSYNAYKEMAKDGADITFYDTFLEILKEKYPKDYKDIMCWNKQSIAGPYKNMFITSKETFFSYCKWIFPKLLELDERMKDYKYENRKGSLRSIAWLSEMLTAFYFWRLSKSVRYKEFNLFRPVAEN